MSTFLELCGIVARESGAASSSSITSVTGNTGELEKIVSFTNDAWQYIQNKHESWQWMRTEFLSDAIIGTARYTAASFSITDWADWITDTPDFRTFSLYDPALGVADEYAITHVDYNRWFAMYGRGSQTNSRPTYWAESPSGEFCLGAIPDLAYRVRGRYRQTNQVLAANGDTPNMPSRFHLLIAYHALVLMAGHDEAAQTYADNKAKARDLMFALERDQLPKMRMMGGTVA
ncbi:MAG: hypothetical protein ABL951_05655 [Alphaproteobacteria bacterium]